MALRNLVLASNTSLPIWNAVQFGPIWSILVQFSPALFTLVQSSPLRPIWSSFNHFGQIRPISVLFGPI